MVSVAVALAEPPLSEGNAAGRVGLALVRGLMSHDFEVRVVAARRHFPGAASQEGELPDDLPVEIVEQPLPSSFQGRWRRVLRPRGGLSDGPFARRFAQVAGTSDIVHLEEVETGWLSARNRQQPSALHVYYLTPLDRDAGRFGTASWRQVTEFTAAETRLVRRHATLIASSPVVADQLHQMAPRALVLRMPLPIDPSYYSAAELSAPVAGFIGTATWGPTALALDRLIRGVWAQVHAMVPESVLHVAGRGTSALNVRQEPLPRGLRVVGEVPSASQFLREISLLLYPLPRGSGVKVKVLEAMASGVPVVTTPCGAEGAPASEGLLVCRDEESLAVTAARLLRDTDERRERGAAARADLIARHSPKPATEALAEEYRRALESS